MGLPVVVKYQVKALEQMAIERGVLHRMAVATRPFDSSGSQLLAVPVGEYLAVVDFAQRKLAECVAASAFESVRERHDQLNLVLAQIATTSAFTSMLMEWARLFPGDSVVRPGGDVLSEFLASVLVVDPGNLPGGLHRFLMTRVRLLEPDRDYAEAVFELVDEQNRQEAFSDLISAVAPRAALAAASLFPVTSGPAIVGFAIQALVGLLEFFAFMADAEEDGLITEEEAQEAWWQLAGVLPFSLVSIILFVRGIGLIGVALFELLLAAIEALPTILEGWLAASEEGWQLFGEMDASSEVFLPAYALNDLRAR